MDFECIQALINQFYFVIQIEIRATSKGELPDNTKESAPANPRSILSVNINIVIDNLFLQFTEPSYFISTPKLIQSPGDRVRNYQFTQLRNIANVDSEEPTSEEDYLKRLNDGSIFFSRAHLIQRKLKRNVRFSIALVQVTRKEDTNVGRLPDSSVNTTSIDPDVPHKLIQNAMNLKLDPERDSLFDIDAYTGKIYINREYLHDMEYNYGDLFILTVVATAYEANSWTALSELENTNTHVFVRITERDYSLIIPVKNSLTTLLSENFNPLKEMYIPRLFEADGIKITIQDLVLSKSVSVEANENVLYNVILQAETNRDKRPANLDKFASLWQNFSMSPVYFSDFQGVKERQFNRRSGSEKDLAFRLEGSDEKPFYLSWMFWLLAVTSLVILVIAVFCLNCYCLNLLMKKNK